METFDTNVVLRMVYRDDPFQADRASLAWQAAVVSGGIFLTMAVLVELAWVLRVAAKFDRAPIAAALDAAAYVRAVEGARGFAVEGHALYVHVGGVAVRAAAWPELARV